jgi:HKD family nuclease
MAGARKVPWSVAGRRRAVAWATILMGAALIRFGLARGDYSRPHLLQGRFDVLFTNPSCRTYAYTTTPQAIDGSRLTEKPKDAYCTLADRREDGPVLTRFLSLAASPSTTEIQVASFSFSNQAVAEALCQAAEVRGAKISVIVDAQEKAAAINRLSACSKANPIELVRRGLEGDTGIFHDKFAIFRRGTGTSTIAFGSGNLGKGLSISHENWVFGEVAPSSYFAQRHGCAFQAARDHGGTLAGFAAALETCTLRIDAPPESDAQIFFAPAEGRDAANALVSLVANAERVDIAAHILSFSRLQRALVARLRQRPQTRVRIVLDDDTHWIGKGLDVGENDPSEALFVRELVQLGAEVRYVETNDSQHLLHHNKFLIAHRPREATTVFGGAGNFSDAAFTQNFESFYSFATRDVVERYVEQFEHLWTNLSTPEARMPAEHSNDVRTVP